MYNYLDSVGYISYIYFPLVVIIGSYFLLSLFLALIMQTFSEMSAIAHLQNDASVVSEQQAEHPKENKEIAAMINVH